MSFAADQRNGDGSSSRNTLHAPLRSAKRDKEERGDDDEEHDDDGELEILLNAACRSFLALFRSGVQYEASGYDGRRRKYEGQYDRNVADRPQPP